MRIEIQLKKVLNNHGLLRHGVIHDIAKDLNVHRHSIAKIYNGQLTNPSLELLGRVCDWVIRHSKNPGAHGLPYDLLGVRPLQLWDAISRCARVTIYLGERRYTSGSSPLQCWVSRQDSSVASNISAHLTNPTTSETSVPRVLTEYVPFHYQSDPDGPGQLHHQEDQDNARRVFEQMRSGETQWCSILIGSQRATMLTELLVAELFGCEPFVSVGDRGPVPFMLKYRDTPSMPSCFGLPAGEAAGPSGACPGIDYLDTDGRWQSCPWTDEDRDCGIVIVLRDQSSETMELALFGFSGRSTQEIGNRLRQGYNEFWPPTSESRGRHVGVYICQFSWQRDLTSGDDIGQGIAHDFEVIPISDQVLEERLK